MRNPPKTILIVDDEPELRSVLRLLLEEEGFRVLQAASADEAMTIIKSTQIDFVLSDVRMPGKAGPELLQELKREGLLRMPFAFISGFSELTFEGAVGMGAVDLITKPFRFERVFDMIRNYL